MGLLSSDGRPLVRRTGAGDPGPGDEERPGAGRTGRGTRARGTASIEPSSCAGRPGIRDLRSHADVRRPAVVGGTPPRVHAVGRAPVSPSSPGAGPVLSRSRDLAPAGPVPGRDHGI